MPKRRTRIYRRSLTKAEIIKLLDSLNVHHDDSMKFKDLKNLLFNELPNYTGKKQYASISNYIENTVMPERIQNIADDLDIFSNYQPPQPVERIQPAALINKDNIIKQINDFKDFEVDFGASDVQTQEAYLYGLIQSLKSLKLVNKNKYLVLRLKFNDGKECMRVINSHTIAHLQHLINVLEGKANDDVEDYTDSDQAVLMGFLDLTGFSLEWYDYKKLTKAFGYFPYYNTIQDLDLSPFGIYHNEHEADYSDNCFILACVQSKLFSADEINLMRSMINTRYIPRDDIKFIAETIGFEIDTYYYNENRKKIDKAVKFNCGDKPELSRNRVLRLLIRCGHGMLYHDDLVPPNKYNVSNLNTLITRMLENHELVYIHDVSKAEKFMSFNFEFEKLEYPPCSVKPFINKNKPVHFNAVYPAIYENGIFHFKTCSVPYNELFDKFDGYTLIYLPSLQELKDVFTNGKYYVKVSMYRQTVQQIRLYNVEKTIILRNFQSLTSIDAREMNINEFFELVKYVKLTLKDKLNININDYSTLPKMSLATAFKFGCFDGVYALSGLPKAFASQCVRGGLVKTLYDGYFAVDNVKCLDINSSYGTSMSVMHGIPKGTPKPFYHSIPENANYAFIQVKVSNIMGDKLGRYGFIHEGINFIDSVLYEELRKYVKCDIEVVNGYYFNEGFNDKINHLSRVLYELRSIDKLNKLGKNMLSSLYGKSLQNAQQFVIRFVQREKLNEFIATHGNFIFDMNKGKNGIFTVKLLKSLNLNYNIPQFGVYVLSESRKRMNEIINYCNENKISIYSIKTDSFVIPSECVKQFENKYKLGHELGEFKVEYEAAHVKFTSKTTYKAELIDGSVRTRGKVK